MDKAAAWLKQALHYSFNDETLLARALTHRSVGRDNNERLEFLGDSVLQLVVSELVYGHTDAASEGRLTRLRASLVKDKTLAEVATSLGIGEHLKLGSGEKSSGVARRPSVLADALEAIFGAVYLDAGFAAARDVIAAAYGERFDLSAAARDLRDPKSRLQEYLQGRGLPVPEYALVEVSGQQHRQTFEAACRIAAMDLETTGQGASRRVAEQQAAAEMLLRVEVENGR